MNTRADLAVVEAAARARLLQQHMLAGVTVVDPGSTMVDADVTIGEDTTLQPFTLLRGSTTVGAGCAVGPGTTLIDSTVADGASVVQSYVQESEVGPRCTIGPFTHLRPGTRMAEGAKAGAFVEIKNSEIGPGVKVPHLSYIGDTDLGEGTNIGAGTITANYDGATKHRTRVGRDVRTGVHTSLVAPVTVGDGAYTGAGSVITEDIPYQALGIARPRQENVEGYAERAPAANKEKSKVKADKERTVEQRGPDGAARSGAAAGLLPGAHPHERPDAVRQAADGVCRAAAARSSATRSRASSGSRSARLS